MNSIDFLLTGLVAIICGTVAQFSSGYSRGGWIVNLGLGYLGALAGVIISRTLNAPLIYNLNVQSTKYPVIYAIIGSVFFVAAIGFILKPGRR